MEQRSKHESGLKNQRTVFLVKGREVTMSPLCLFSLHESLVTEHGVKTWDFLVLG